MFIFLLVDGGNSTLQNMPTCKNTKTILFYRRQVKLLIIIITSKPHDQKRWFHFSAYYWVKWNLFLKSFNFFENLSMSAKLLPPRYPPQISNSPPRARLRKFSFAKTLRIRHNFLPPHKNPIEGGGEWSLISMILKSIMLFSQF